MKEVTASSFHSKAMTGHLLVAVERVAAAAGWERKHAGTVSLHSWGLSATIYSAKRKQACSSNTSQHLFST